MSSGAPDTATAEPIGHNSGLVKVRLPALFGGLFPTAPRYVELAAGSVDELLGALDAQWPGMRDRICDSSPAIRSHMNVFVKGKRAKLNAVLEGGDDVYILTAISGG